jgi:hypothetical protein
MLDNLFRPIITNKILKDILKTCENEENKPEDFWVKVSLGSNYMYYGGYAGGTTFDSLKEMDAEYLTTEDQHYWILGKMIFEVNGKPMFFVRRPELVKGPDDKEEWSGTIYAEVKVIPTKENIELLTAMANEGFGIGISLAGSFSGTFVYDHLQIWNDDPGQLKSTKAKVIKNPFAPKED